MAGKPEKAEYKGFAERLVQVRSAQKKKINQKDFGADVGCSLASWQEYESAKSAPSAKVLLALIRNKGVSANWILTGEGSMNYSVEAVSETSAQFDIKEYVENMETVVKVLWEEVARAGATLTPTGAAGIVAMAFEEYSKSEDYETLCNKMKSYVRLANQETK